LSYDLINDCLQPWVLDLVTDGDFQVDQNNRESDPSPTIVNGQESRRISGYWDFVGYDAFGWDFFYDSLFISPTDNVYRITDVYGKVNKGTFSVLDDKLTFSTNAGSSDTFTYKLDGNRLTLIWDNVPNSEIYILYFNRTDENNSESVTSEPNINIKVGEKVTDFKATDVNGTTYYDDYLKYYQCVSYAFARAREKLGFLAACEMIPGFRVVSAKDTAVIAEKYNGRSCINHSSGKNYIITVFNYANLNPDEIKTRVKSDLLPNSYASFNSLGTNSVDGGHGHIIFVEDVVSEDGTLYVYFSEGGNTRHELDGVLQKITFNELVERGGGLNGIVAFELRN
nr:hypothetical protein [Clostridia bacterium]